MHRRRSHLRAGLVTVLAALLAGLTFTLSGAAQPTQDVRPGAPSRASVAVVRPDVEQATDFAVSAPLRDYAGPSAIVGARGDDEESGEGTFPGIRQRGVPEDPVVQRRLGAGAAPTLLTSFEGIPQVSSPPKPHPPDTNGEIGPTAYVQMVNLRVAVYDRSGKPLMGPVPYQAIFGPLGGSCGVLDRGDPIVVYDQLADRWLLSQFGFIEQNGNPVGPYFQCIAVSKTGDPTGAYYLYAFKISDTQLNDYPKLAVWPDAYYMSANNFDFSSPFVFSGSVAVAFDRAAMIAGDPNAAMVKFEFPFTDEIRWGLLPADLDGFRLPPAGEPEPYVQIGFHIFQGPKPELRVFRFHVDWDHPGNSSFTGPTVIPTAPFNASFCNSTADPCIAQKGTFQTLDPLSDRLMFRAAYRNFGDHESLVVNHTVDVGNDQAGVRWYELRNLSGTPALFQQGTFAPDTASRWMGSAAMDGNGDIALGYSVSSKTMYPSVRFTARRADDTLGEMTLGEGSLVEGSGSQTSVFARWGDYSDLTVDPLDDCTFWYTQEYYPQTAERDWHTRIGSFVIPGCDATAPTVAARAAKAKAGKQVALKYTTSDNSGQTRELLTIFRSNGGKLRTIEVPLHAAGAKSVKTAAPKAAGVYRWQVVAIDAKGNESAPSTARLRVT
jgi:hypothetical protein